MEDPFEGVDRETYEAFKKYHLANRRVWEMFEGLALKVKNQGFKTYSAKTIMEVIRWHEDIDTNTCERFKINNNYTSLYVRALIRKRPEFIGFFELREVHGLKAAA